MAAITTEKLSQLPDEMLRFTIQKAAETLSPRLGTLSLPGRKAIETPNFLGNTSRGVVPHLSQDNLKKHLSLGGVYVAIEDCRCRIEAVTLYDSDACFRACQS